MFRILRLFFTVFGIISFIFWSGMGYGWVTDAYGVRSATMNIVKIFSSTAVSGGDTTLELEGGDGTGSATDTIPPTSAVPLTNDQREALESVGISSSALPASLTPIQLQCIEAKIGVVRMEAIVNGATPTPFEVLSAASCL